MTAKGMAMTSPQPPRKNTAAASRLAQNEEDEIDDADMVAEEIEAGYDVQSNAATKALVDDPASSSDNSESVAE